ncbi:hypothetical protein AeMF1_002638 [Aphanomyces euteiches]|nr:hypothetical protein AeMF1_002638 [Aphanomyces euteiches]KAH9191637.1 hypothetical protein AeNC1_006381 [Aphanomyces euteiches]
MSLVADYASDSDSDGPTPVTVPKTVAEPTPVIFHPPSLPSVSEKKPVAPKPPKKKKKVLHLPPEIQKLLESGRTLNSDDESDDEKAPAKRKAVTKAKNEAPADLLSFLPPPKVALKVLPATQAPPKTHTATLAEPQDISTDSEPPQTAQDNFVSNYSFDDEHAAEDYGQGKRRRNNERELERLLQQGQFDAVAGKITEVQAVAPDAWQRPIDARGYSHDKEAQVLASMAGTETEAGYVISSYRPTRLQRQRHQLNQLTFDAKVRELDLLDSRATMARSKKETAAKYGW